MLFSHKNCKNVLSFLWAWLIKFKNMIFINRLLLVDFKGFEYKQYDDEL